MLARDIVERVVSVSMGSVGKKSARRVVSETANVVRFAVLIRADEAFVVVAVSLVRTRRRVRDLLYPSV